jgi:hypothetical protein
LYASRGAHTLVVLSRPHSTHAHSAAADVAKANRQSVVKRTRDALEIMS